VHLSHAFIHPSACKGVVVRPLSIEDSPKFRGFEDPASPRCGGCVVAARQRGYIRGCTRKGKPAPRRGRKATEL
jgi:hypothetical protein